MINKFKKDQTLIVIANNNTGHYFQIGDKVKVIKIFQGIDELYACHHVDNEKNVWAVKGEDLGVIV